LLVVNRVTRSAGKEESMKKHQEEMTMRELLEALRVRGVEVPFWRIEYLLKTDALTVPLRDRRNTRLFTSKHVAEILAVEARRSSDNGKATVS